METPKVRRFKDLRYVDFKVVKEPWNTYKLADGSTLRAKLVLTNVIVDRDFGEIVRKAKATKKGRIKLGLAIQATTVASSRIPKNLRGPSSPPTTEATPLLAQEDIDFETVSERWNEYKLEHGVGLRIKQTLLKVDRTNKYDEQGIPGYNVQGSAILRITPSK